MLPAAAAVLALASALAACSNASPDPAAGGDDRGAITFATGKDTSGNLQKQVDTWNAAHPNEKVTIVELPASADDQLKQLQQNAQVKSDAYSVLGLDVVWTAQFAANRWIDEIPASTDTSGLLTSAIESAKYRGTLYAVPWQTNGGLLFYRTDLLTAAGITTAPATWAQMQDACAKVKALPQGKDVSCYAGQFDKYEGLVVNFAEAVQSAGGRVFDEQGNPTVDAPQAKAALTWLVSAFNDGTIPKAAITYKEEDGRKAFQDGTLVFLRQWPYVWDLANKTDGSSKVAGKFAVAALPGLNGPGSSTLGGLNLAVSSFGKNKATARDFITYLTGEEAQRANLLATSTAPTRTSLYADAALQKQFPYLPYLQKSLESAVARPKAVHYGDVSAAIQNAIAPVIAGDTDAATALTALQANLKQLTAQ
ncbi:ABC transporter substrate-binding protein [Acrocarpospora catenulata]|uniref:ABC transporter substrate-binding protein n=1 Tax=Acrocarpospora catenulata TaxID=2836182 RepID=UPI001BD99187|nr:ABC transporter substrate-binding protein [Acrocarpospora catenulata]